MFQEVLSNDYAILYFHENDGIIHHVFHQPASGDNLRNVLNTGLNVMEEYQVVKWLSDERYNTGVNEEDTQWVNEYWFDAARQAGWKYWALVVPEEIAARMNMTQFVDMTYEAGIRVMVFSDPDEAMEWLQQF